MTKPMHIVFASHGDSRSFLFFVPSDEQIFRGEVLFVDTVRGETTAMATSDSFWVTQDQAEQIVAGTGAYFPLKGVTGRQVQVMRTEKVALAPEERRKL